MLFQTQQSQTKTPQSASIIQNNLYTFVGTLAGVLIGVMGSLAMAGPMLNSEVASATKQLNASLASDTQSGSCAASFGGGGASNSNNAKTSAHTEAALPEGGKGGDSDQPSGGNTWVNHLVGGLMTTTTATISDTGPNSTNKVTTVNKNTTKIENNNNVTVTNSSSQTSNSGSANVSGNTNAGSAQSGHATNDNDTNTSISVNN